MVRRLTYRSCQQNHDIDHTDCYRNAIVVIYRRELNINMLTKQVNIEKDTYDNVVSRKRCGEMEYSWPAELTVPVERHHKGRFGFSDCKRRISYRNRIRIKGARSHCSMPLISVRERMTKYSLYLMSGARTSYYNMIGDVLVSKTMRSTKVTNRILPPDVGKQPRRLEAMDWAG